MAILLNGWILPIGGASAVKGLCLQPAQQACGFKLEHPQGVGIVGTVGIVGLEFCRPEPRPTTLAF